MEEIFLRLPINSLLKFRRVSKSWLSLIESPRFVKAHVNRNKDLRNLRILASTMNEFQLVDYSLQSLLDGSTTDASSKVYHQVIGNSSRKNFYLVAFCDGLICILSGNNFLLWNPSTRKSKMLPSLELENSYTANYGLSYDDSCDDYKLVVTLCTSSVYGFYSDREVKVCSIKTGSWKKIGDFHGRIPFDTQVSMKGKHHWPERAYVDGCQRINIVSLDIATEKFGVMEPPNSEVGYLYRLLLFGQFLSAYYSSTNQAYLWVMKEYGIKESWTKVMTISFETFTGLQTMVAFKPIYISGDGDQVILFNGHFLFFLSINGHFLVVYCPKVQHAFGPAYYCRPNARLYVESLVSPA